MDWNTVEGKWEEYKGKAKHMWGKLTDDDLTAIAGKREILVGKLRAHYGYAEDEAKKEVDRFLSDPSCCSTKSKSSCCN
jgi:uncharacterized protein YjbJ (UPF0337 family)